MNKKFSDKQIQEFWQHHTRFLDTDLITETPNPNSYNLSQLCQNYLPEAFRQFQYIELQAIKSMYQYTNEIVKLQINIRQCLENGNNIYLIGCGASGRLIILLKRLWEIFHPNNIKQIKCVNSAGDTSLIRSVEQFEDKAEFGIKQLIAQGYTNNDLVIGLSASGESPFVIATVAHASITSSISPWLVFNNPISILHKRNSNHISTNPKVNSLALDVGMMALTGSTRLQATTAMQIAMGLALCSTNTDIIGQIKQIYAIIESIPLTQLTTLTAHEADLFAQKHFILYRTTNPLMGLSLLTDITERAPTFNLIPFENLMEQERRFSPFYLSLDNAPTIDVAWKILLGQQPTCLEWDSFIATKRSYINGFDLSANSLRKTGSYLPAQQHSEMWQPYDTNLLIYLDKIHLTLPLPTDLLYKTIVYKFYLNSHSTLMMGRLGYFDGNLMLSLKPSNNKLIDRAIRYSQFILQTKHQHTVEYKELATIVFAEIEKLEPNQSIVSNVINAVLNKVTTS